MTRERASAALRVAVALAVRCSAGVRRRAADNPNVIVVGITSGPNNLDPRIGTDDVVAEDRRS